MAAILQQVTGPLQLAGLFLLLVAGLGRLLVRSGKSKLSPELSRLIVNRIFAASLAALILGIGIPAAAPWIQTLVIGSDEMFHGAVLSATGEAVPNAVVNVLTLGTTTTNPLGQFELSIPRSRAMHDYKVQVTAPGYRTPDLMTKTDAEMRNVDITLTLEPRPLIRAFASYVAVGQFFGAPVLLITLHVENSTSAIAIINDLRGNLSGSGASYTLFPTSWTILGQFGPFQPVSGPFPFQPGQVADLRVVMFTGLNFTGMYQQLTAMPAYKSQPPCTYAYNGSVSPLTDDAFSIVEAFADGHFSWKPGDWHFELAVVAEGKPQTFQKDFALSAPEVDGLRRSVSLLRQCQSANLNAPFAQDGAIANFVSK
jgi:hypothetical protein